LEQKIIPAYYNKDKNGISKEWMDYMKESIVSTGGKYSTSRMLSDYTSKFYIPLCNLHNKYYKDLSDVTQFNTWKTDMYRNWKDIKITQKEDNLNNISIDAGNCISVKCQVELPNIKPEFVSVECYYGKILENGVVEDISIIPMQQVKSKSKNAETENSKIFEYETKIELKTGGNYGYTFRVMPKNDMLLDSANMNLVKWITQE